MNEIVAHINIHIGNRCEIKIEKKKETVKLPMIYIYKEEMRINMRSWYITLAPFNLVVSMSKLYRI